MTHELSNPLQYKHLIAVNTAPIEKKTRTFLNKLLLYKIFSNHSWLSILLLFFIQFILLNAPAVVFYGVTSISSHFLKLQPSTVLNCSNWLLCCDSLRKWWNMRKWKRRFLLHVLTRIFRTSLWQWYTHIYNIQNLSILQLP